MRMHNDNSEFWILLEPFYNEVSAFCKKLTRENDQGNDLFQDALLKAMDKFDSLRDKNSFRPWLYRIIIRTFRSRFRKGWWKKRVKLSNEILNNMKEDSSADLIEAKQLVTIAMKPLSSEQKALITLFELEQWTITELSQLYGKSEGSIKASLFRTRKKMKKAILSAIQTPTEMLNNKTENKGSSKCVAPKLKLD